MIRATRSSDSGEQWVISASIISVDSVDWTTTARNHSDIATFSSFEFDEQGRISSWTIDDKNSLSNVVGSVNRSQVINGTKVRVLTGYRDTSSALEVTYQAEGRGKPASVTDESYVNGGRSRKGETTPYQLELSGRGVAWGSSIFPRSDWDGQLTFSSYMPETAETEIRVVQRPFAPSLDAQVTEKKS